MAYVGIGNRQDYVADFQSQNFSGDGSTTAFTLNYEAVTGSIRVAVDNVLQPADGSSYTCNGFTLNFSAAPASGTDNITVLFLGTVRNIASVSDGAIVTSKIADGSITEAKFASGVSTITEADQWRLTAATNNGTDDVISTNWERNDRADFSVLGTGVSESSGVFSFPQTGLYYFLYSFMIDVDIGDVNANIQFRTTQDNSTYTHASQAFTGNGSSSDITSQVTNSYLFNVTNISNDKFRFQTNNFGTNTNVAGNTDRQYSGFTVLRIGDSI